MARRLNTRQATSVREHIRTTQLVKRLQKHALGKLEMTNEQRDSAKFLITQTMPKPAQTIIQDVTNRHVTELSDAELERRIADLSGGIESQTGGKTGSAEIH